MFGIKSLIQVLRRFSQRRSLKKTKAAPASCGGQVKVEARQLAVVEVETPGGIDNVDQNLKKRIKNLGEAINESLSESQPIAEAISDIKEAGYDVFLVLEATIGFTKQDEETEERPAMVAASGSTREPQFQVTAQDMKFLKSLKIKLDDAA